MCLSVCLCVGAGFGCHRSSVRPDHRCSGHSRPLLLRFFFQNTDFSPMIFFGRLHSDGTKQIVNNFDARKCGVQSGRSRLHERIAERDKRQIIFFHPWFWERIAAAFNWWLFSEIKTLLFSLTVITQGHEGCIHHSSSVTAMVFLRRRHSWYVYILMTTRTTAFKR